MIFIVSSAGAAPLGLGWNGSGLQFNGPECLVLNSAALFLTAAAAATVDTSVCFLLSFTDPLPLKKKAVLSHIGVFLTRVSGADKNPTFFSRVSQSRRRRIFLAFHGGCFYTLRLNSQTYLTRWVVKCALKGNIEISEKSSSTKRTRLQLIIKKISNTGRSSNLASMCVGRKWGVV